MIIIGVGTGGIKSNVSPLIAEQYRGTKQRIKVLKNGERVIVDPGITIQRIYSVRSTYSFQLLISCLCPSQIFYFSINIGSLSSIATTELEKHTGFWTAYLLCLCMFVVGIAVVMFGKRFYIVRPPQGSIITQSFRAMWIGLVSGFNMGKVPVIFPAMEILFTNPKTSDAARPSHQASIGQRHKTPWTDHFIDELKRGLIACRVFAFFPIYWVVYTQMLNNFISQAGVMELHGIPNDLMQNIDPLTIIIFIPICDYLLYPFLRKIGLPFRPITRITMGFIFAALAMAYAAIVQHLIYTAPPCYNAPMACDAAGPDGTIPNKVHVAVQTPAYLFIGLSEIFASITGLEYAFTKAPPSMKSFVMSIFLLQNGFGSALAIALSPTAEDPKIIWMYTGICVATIIAGGLFWFCFKGYNETEEEMNALEDKGEQPVPASMIDGSGGVEVRRRRSNRRDEFLIGDEKDRGGSVA